MILIGKHLATWVKAVFKENYSIIDGNPPEINLLNEKNNGEAVLYLIENNLVLSSHDISNGGLLTALSEMSMGSSLGIKIEKSKKLRNLNEYFLEKTKAGMSLKSMKKFSES